MFLKSYARPFLGLTPPANAKKQISTATEDGTLSADMQQDALTEDDRQQLTEAHELIEKDIRDRFKRMCEGYFETIAKKLVKEHLVCIPNGSSVDACDD